MWPIVLAPMVTHVFTPLNVSQTIVPEPGVANYDAGEALFNGLTLASMLKEIEYGSAKLFNAEIC